MSAVKTLNDAMLSFYLILSHFSCCEGDQYFMDSINIEKPGRPGTNKNIEFVSRLQLERVSRF